MGGMDESSSRSMGRTVVAGIVALVALWFLLVPIIHLIRGCSASSWSWPRSSP